MNHTLRIACSLANKNYKHILEFGVYKGGTIKQLRNSFDKEMKIFGFDSFEGLPEDWVGTTCVKGDMSTDGIVPSIEGVTFYKGWFNETIPLYKKEYDPSNMISILHVDCDLYSSTIEVLYSLRERIAPGTILVFDEWYYNHRDNESNRQHEQKAFFEWTKEFNIKYAMFNQIEDERRIIKIV